MDGGVLWYGRERRGTAHRVGRATRTTADGAG